MIIFKRQKIEDAIYASMVRYQQRGTRRNLIGECCPKCKLLFETYRNYRKRTCQLCRYEAFIDRGGKEQDFFKRYHGIKSAEELYPHCLGRAVVLYNRKTRIMRASGCVIVNRALSERLEEYDDLLEHE